jgi:hypothetical protein
MMYPSLCYRKAISKTSDNWGDLSLDRWRVFDLVICPVDRFHECSIRCKSWRDSPIGSTTPKDEATSTSGGLRLDTLLIHFNLFGGLTGAGLGWPGNLTNVFV